MIKYGQPYAVFPVDETFAGLFACQVSPFLAVELHVVWRDQFL